MRRSALVAAILVAVAGMARAEVPRVVTDIPPVQSLVAQVMGDLGTPEVLLGRGASPHEFQLRPSQAAGLTRADLIFWIGPELTPWLDRALKGVGGAENAVALLHAPGTFTLDFAAGADDDHDQDRDAAAAGDHDHDHEEGHHHEGLNPHAWLDPANAEHWLDVIADDLAARDPEHAATYRANAAEAKAGIAAADARNQALLAPVATVPLVVAHDAFGYFAKHYGINIVGAVALGDAARPGAARLAEIRARLKSYGHACVFPDADQDPKLVAAVAEGTGARLGRPLDPAGTLLDRGPGLYVTLIDGLAQTIADCATE
ncbi:zinc ABC transporter substrate-binding protein [Acidimangrovimonas pyrenivorans]|uniref:High-affinity zinc uptake system protein ZnuA n=1 Tax=Acidimangrovimonas pyrenivorans TaxID=2030798 RepID=A0ABV7ABA5_9RHOB